MPRREINPYDFRIDHMPLENGEIQINYVLNGTFCIAREIHGHMAKQAASAQALVKDLELVIEALSFIILLYEIGDVTVGNDEHREKIPDDTKNRIASNLFISAVVTYCKGFVEARGRTFQLQDPAVRAITSAEIFEVHKKVKQWRHNWIAHAGNSKMESSKCVHVIDPSPEGGHCIFTHTSFSFHSGKDELLLFLELATIVHKKYTELTIEKTKLVRDYVEKHPNEPCEWNYQVTFHNDIDGNKQR